MNTQEVMLLFDVLPGFSISGGSDSKTQPDVRVDQVFPGGAAMAEGSLKVGLI